MKPVKKLIYGSAELRLSKSEKEASKKLQRLCVSEFACQEDAVDAAENLAKQLKYHCLTEACAVEVIPNTTKKTSIQGGQSLNGSYRIQATLVRNQSVIETEMRRAGRFVLATNVIDAAQLSNDGMLSEYKAQQAASRGFGFLKDPLFFTDSIFLKSPERVEALAMLMGLCLLVYTLAQRQLRQSLKQSQSRIKSQLGKLTERPTLRWVFQC